MKKIGVIAKTSEIVLEGTTTKLSDWQHSSDKSKIDGAKIHDGSITASKLGTNEIYVRATAAQIEKKTGLAADSTGVKASSPRFKFSSKGAKQLILRSSISSIPSDATVRVGVYNVTKGAYVFYRDYAGATGENEDTQTDLSGIDDGDVLEIRVEVTTASGTSGATFDLDYASLMVDYGFS